MTCRSCNGWGIVLMILNTPGSNTPQRLQQRKRFKDDPTTLHTLEVACTPCGGYGTVPDR